MRRKIKLVISFILITLISFGNEAKNDFPTEIHTAKTERHIRVPGTKVYGIIPADFQYIRNLIRYQKNDNLYVQFVESNASNFTKAKPNFTREKIEAKGAKVDVLKNIKLNEFDAIYCEGPSKNPNETQLMLIFGDESFVVIIVGVCKTADKKVKEELQEILKSIYYDKTFAADPMELANFEFDQTITNFKYTTTVSSIFIYSENGKDDIQNSAANSMQIEALPEMAEKKAESYSKDLLRRYEKNGVRLDNQTILKTKINGHTAYVLEAKMKSDDKEGILYQAVIIYENTTILYTATAYSDISNYLIKFKKTAETIKIK